MRAGLNSFYTRGARWARETTNSKFNLSLQMGPSSHILLKHFCFSLSRSEKVFFGPSAQGLHFFGLSSLRRHELALGATIGGVFSFQRSSKHQVNNILLTYFWSIASIRTKSTFEWSSHKQRYKLWDSSVGEWMTKMRESVGGPQEFVHQDSKIKT
jgi:hypothetical protein